MSVADALRDHVDDVRACPGAVLSDVLTTSWTSGGLGRLKQTEREEGESDADFKVRHLLSVVLCMLPGLHPPDDQTDIVTGRFDSTPDNVTTTVACA